MKLRYFHLLGVLIKNKLNRSMIYSTNFWMVFVVDFTLFLFHLLSFMVIYQYTDSINGWGMYQMFVFVGTFSIVDSLIMGSTFFGIISLPERIRTGTLDLVLTKPVDPQFFVSCDSFNPGSFLGLITGSAMVIYGMVQGGYSLLWYQIPGYLILVAVMTALDYSLILIVRTFAFFFIRINGIEQAENSIFEFAFRVPGSAYQGISKLLFLVILPYGLIATVPTQFLTDKITLPQWGIIAGVVVFFTLASRLFFKFGLSRYTSTSS